MEILVKNRNFAEKLKFGQKWKFCSKIEIKNWFKIFGSKFWAKIEILVKN